MRATACASEGSAEVAAQVVMLILEKHGIQLDDNEQAQLLGAYRRGVRNTLVSVGLGFGLEPVRTEEKVESGVPPIAGLLWAETTER